MFVSYAQNFEDVILWRALKHISRGTYIDVGAHDPVVDSVSLAFYERGWRGTHVEPIAHYAAKLRRVRSDEEVIEAAVGSGGERITLYEIAGTGLSTGDPIIAAKHKTNGRDIQARNVSCLPLSDILNRHKAQDVHWLKIDVEGMEAQVIESWAPSPLRPWIVLVESTFPNSSERTYAAWDPKLLELGYDFVYFDGLNRFYVSRNHPELVASFGPGPNLFDDFVLTSTAPFCRKVKAEIVNLSEKLAQQQSELAQRREIAQRLEKGKAAAEHKFDELDLRLRGVYASRSWRITKPLRTVGRLMLRLRAGIQSIRGKIANRINALVSPALRGDAPLSNPHSPAAARFVEQKMIAAPLEIQSEGASSAVFEVDLTASAQRIYISLRAALKTRQKKH
jgi:FkbM family methyltransferase